MTAWILKKAGELLAPFSPERRLAILAGGAQLKNQYEINMPPTGTGREKNQHGFNMRAAG